MATLRNTSISSTVSARLPIGTTSERPTGQVGMLRYNTTTVVPEIFTGVVWDPLYPVGSVMYFATTSTPDGWLRCNGAAVSTSTYPALFASIGYTWGGSGATFNLPDLRGEFPRCWDDGRGVDSGRGITAFQDQDWKGYWMSNTGSGTFAYSHGPVYFGKSIFPSHTGNLFGGHWSAPAAALGTAWDTSEVRPRNRALLPCIKF